MASVNVCALHPIPTSSSSSSSSLYAQNCTNDISPTTLCSHRFPSENRRLPFLRSSGGSKSRLRLTRSWNERRSRGGEFLDENGVVNDMDGYLNQLSLEYDSVWDTKPSWCQPWTITLTGVLAIGCSWLILHSLLVTALISFLICTWWYIFLYSYPKAYTDMIAERRKKVTSGLEDTYGMKKSD